jgi:quercetin dioxygenase-like cupin family protein
MKDSFLNVLKTEKVETTHKNSVNIVRLIKNGEIYGNVATHNYAWLEKDQKIKEHAHPDSIEFFFVIAGVGIIRLNSEVHEIQAGDFISVQPGYEHSLENLREERFIFTTLRIILNND